MSYIFSKRRRKRIKELQVEGRDHTVLGAGVWGWTERHIEGREISRTTKKLHAVTGWGRRRGSLERGQVEISMGGGGVHGVSMVISF